LRARRWRITADPPGPDTPQRILEQGANLAPFFFAVKKLANLQKSPNFQLNSNTAMYLQKFAGQFTHQLQIFRDNLTRRP
jgi:hypothetical protein